ncbi:MAG: hypothetical protein JWM28_3872 [Chitinophagaceae bacterium]|nr:hypothetical protein [Chitinophagaceae bacterium]
MKSIYSLFIVFSLFTFSTLNATTITATVNHGDWTSNGTWTPNRTPQTGDTIIIPTGITVNVFTNVAISGYVYVQLYGTLLFNQSAKLDLVSSSKIYIYAGGKVSSLNSSSSDQVRIGSSSVYKGNIGDLNGPVLLDNGGSHPVAAIPLPVKFVKFVLVRQQANVLVQWSTAQESNSSYFTIERSENGVSWTSIGTVKAAGESSSLINYTFTDKNANGSILYYRIKQVDLDGAYIYTQVATIKSTDSNAAIKVTSTSKNTLLINFSQQVKSKVMMRLISASGQVVSQQDVSNPSGQIVFATTNHASGIYIVNITDANGLSIAKQILL